MVGLPECGLCICPGWGGTQMLPARMDPATAMAATANGTPWPSTAVPTGLFDQVLPTGSTVAQMVDAACAWIHAERSRAAAPAKRSEPRRTLSPALASRVAPALASARAIVPASAHAEACFDCVDIGLRQGWTAAVAAERAHLVRLRHTPEARAKLQAFLSR